MQYGFERGSITSTGFAVNLNLMLSKTSARFDAYAKLGHLEDSVLKHLVNITDLEAKAADCSKASIGVEGGGRSCNWFC